MGDRHHGKEERLAEFLRRLELAPAAPDFDSAFLLFCETLNAVEDAMTDLPFAPENWMADGRMYPPQMDNAYPVANRPGFVRFRSKGHNSIIGADGSIEIKGTDGRLILEKPGSGGARR